MDRAITKKSGFDRTGIMLRPLESCLGLCRGLRPFSLVRSVSSRVILSWLQCISYSSYDPPIFLCGFSLTLGSACSIDRFLSYGACTVLPPASRWFVEDYLALFVSTWDVLRWSFRIHRLNQILMPSFFFLAWAFSTTPLFSQPSWELLPKGKEEDCWCQ